MKIKYSRNIALITLFCLLLSACEILTSEDASHEAPCIQCVESNQIGDGYGVEGDEVYSLKADGIISNISLLCPDYQEFASPAKGDYTYYFFEFTYIHAINPITNDPSSLTYYVENQCAGNVNEEKGVRIFDFGHYAKSFLVVPSDVYQEQIKKWKLMNYVNDSLKDTVAYCTHRGINDSFHYEIQTDENHNFSMYSYTYHQGNLDEENGSPSPMEELDLTSVGEHHFSFAGNLGSSIVINREIFNMDFEEVAEFPLFHQGIRHSSDSEEAATQQINCFVRQEFINQLDDLFNSPNEENGSHGTVSDLIF